MFLNIAHFYIKCSVFLIMLPIENLVSFVYQCFKSTISDWTPNRFHGISDMRWFLVRCLHCYRICAKGKRKIFHKIKIDQNKRTIKSQTNVSAFASLFMCSFRNALNVFATKCTTNNRWKKKHYTETVILQFYVFNKLWYFIDHLYSLT